MTAFAYFDKKGVVDVSSVSASVTGVKVNTIVILSRRCLIPMQNTTKGELHAMFIDVTQGEGWIEEVNIVPMSSYEPAHRPHIGE